MFAVKLALKLNNNEATLMAKHAGFRRVVFYLGLSLRTQAKAKLAKLQSKVSKPIKGSKNQHQTYNNIDRIHARIACIRKELLHKLTTYLAKTFKLIKIEDLNVKGLIMKAEYEGQINSLTQQLAEKTANYHAVLARLAVLEQGSK